MSFRQVKVKNSDVKGKDLSFEEFQKIVLLFLVLLSILSRLLVAMTQRNGTEVTEFYLLGFRDQEKFHSILFLVFLVIYVTSMLGNTAMILLINTDSRLHTPMYFFLQHLAFVDICYTSAITPIAPELHGRRQIHIIQRVCNPVIGVCNICDQRLLPPGSDGSGPLHSHLQATSLSHYHVPNSLHPASSWLIPHGITKCLCAHRLYIFPVLL